MPGSSKDFNEWLLMIILMALIIFCGGILWMVTSNVFGPLYKWMRTIETLGLWMGTGWGRYFWSVPAREHYEFWSLFKSSIPFGIMCSAIVAVLGYIAFEKVKVNHISNHVSHKAPPSYEMIMEKQAALFPHNEFYARFRMSDYPQDRGAASMPLTAQQLIKQSDAVTFQPGGVNVFDIPKLSKALKGRFGSKNPFLSNIRLDGGKTYRRGSDDEVQAVVDELPWHHVVVLYPALIRIAALGSSDETKVQFFHAVKRSDEFMREVWRDILKAAKSEKEAHVVLDAQYGPASSSGKKGKSLAAVLEAKGTTMRTVVRARTALRLMLVETPDEAAIAAHDKLVPTCSLEPKTRKQIYSILGGHGFSFGVLARALEVTREAGIFPPNTFGWMRFMDQSLWRMLVYIGMRTPCAEASGMFEHYTAELKAGMPFLDPYVDDAPFAVIRDARKFTFSSDDDDDGLILPSKEEMVAGAT